MDASTTPHEIFSADVTVLEGHSSEVSRALRCLDVFPYNRFHEPSYNFLFLLHLFVCRCLLVHGVQLALF